MVTISHIVKKIVHGQPFVEEGLGEGIISVASLAEQLQPKIEQELNKKIKLPAVVMALRRYAEEITIHREKSRLFDYTGELLVKTNIADFTFVKTHTLLAKLRTIHNLVDFEKGDTLNIILGNNEVSIIINEKHMQDLAKFLGGEKIINREKDLVSLTVVFTKGDFTHTHGIIFNAVRKLA